ncbi:MAG TPA: glycoside hydrolase family 15 protein [Bryobacteraceae bacterium]|jgi:GH15 family glucan-1,4-alpha-glucosidase|nr:glycoside hydrolase family 15 protein [Bryobacteraceae bacterium]
MAQFIEDYALIGNNSTCALVGRNGSIDWLCFPRYDSAACFASLLGSRHNGRWLIAPDCEQPEVKRRYRPGTLVLETEFSTPEGAVLLIDCMDRRGESQDVIRLVKGLRGRVRMQMELILRFDYGGVTPWVRRLSDGRTQAIVGPDRVTLATPAPVRGEDMTTRSDFEIAEGEEVPFILTWSHSHVSEPQQPDAASTVDNVTRAWEKWSGKHVPKGPYKEAVLRSLITLKALTHYRTGGIIAAPTTSLPEEIGGPRNWDYRFCWLRDSTFTLLALLESGFIEEARNWRDWLMRAVAGNPEHMQIMYGVAGERRLTEFELHELDGYEGSAPVRIGNAASEQLQLDVYGEVMDSLFQARDKGLEASDEGWDLQKALLRHLERIWSGPDDGIWEIRGPRRHFVFSKVMAWVAFDRAVRTIEKFGEQGPLDRWRKIRADIHGEICKLGYSNKVQSFVQFYGTEELDASVLMMPLVGFLPATDERVKNTVKAIEKHLLVNGLVARYDPSSGVDGLSSNHEGTFLACSFWLADNYVLQGRMDEARELFERLLSLRNDVGLLAEEYDPLEKRQLGNFPQAFSHLSLVNTAHNISAHTEGKPGPGLRSRRHHL